MTVRALPELEELERLVALAGALAQTRELCRIEVAGRSFPVHAVMLGSGAAGPAVGFFGGVHGLERIGSAVVLTYLRSLLMRLRWDDSAHRLLDSVRLLFVPLLNPGGMWLGTRANPNGVDLMRNAPLDAAEKVPFLLGGHRISAALPWYRGPAGAPMEAESRALCEIAREELMSRPLSIALDCHSGFGMVDRIWFPYARSRNPAPHLAEYLALKGLLDDTYCHHRYEFEPQNLQYLAHGDLWDHLYAEATGNPARTFLPLTLEMGSWLWVRKNPLQLFSRGGMFNPVARHRLHRVLRRHISLLDLLARAGASHRRWLPVAQARSACEQRGLRRWYGGTEP